MASRGLPVELKAARLQPFNDRLVPKSRQASHSGRNHDCVVSPFARRLQVRSAASLAASFYQFSRDITCDLERFSDGPSLRNKAGEFIRGRKEETFRKLLDLDPNCQFHTG